MSVVQKVMKAVVRLMPDKPADQLIDSRVHVGKPISRVDGPLKVTGGARFAAEVPLAGMAYAAVKYSTIASGRIASIETADAEASPGVVLVMTYKNALRMGDPLLAMQNPKGAAGSKLPVMQDASIHWNGEPVAVVIAETQEQAEHAATLVRVTYDEEPASLSFDAAKATPRELDDVFGEPSKIEVGDAEAALREAQFQVDRTFRTPRYNHCAIELHAATVAWKGDELTVHDATQMLTLTRSTLAEVFHIEEAQVRVLSPYVGGAFGNKALWSHQILAIAAAKMIQRPVRLVLSREGVFRATGGRTPTEQRVALGANAAGPLASLIHTGTVGMTPHNYAPEQFTFPARHLYAADTFLIHQNVADLNMVANTFMRAPGESVGTFALEAALDELADVMSIDPIELRRRIEPQKDPTSGLPFSSRHLVDAYRVGAERFGWHKRNPKPRSQRDGDWLIGYGVATGTYPYYRMPGGSARIHLTVEGRATVQMAMHEMGMGTATVQAQHAAERLALPLNHVTFEYGDSSLPNGTLAGGSSQTATTIGAVIAASEELFKQLLKLAGRSSPLSGLKPGDVEAFDSGLRSRHDPQRHETYAAILQRAGQSAISCEAAGSQPLETLKYSMHSYAAQFCEVRVNAVTGETRVVRWLGSFDTGRILNSKTAASQFRGGIIMGLGLALSEETLFDERSGRIMNPSLAEYHVPVHLDVPEIDVIWRDLPDPHSPLGVHGIGEIGITGVGAAVANAVYNATGVRVSELPITLDKLL